MRLGCWVAAAREVCGHSKKGLYLTVDGLVTAKERDVVRVFEVKR